MLGTRRFLSRSAVAQHLLRGGRRTAEHALEQIRGVLDGKLVQIRAETQRGLFLNVLGGAEGFETHDQADGVVGADARGDELVLAGIGVDLASLETGRLKVR